MDQSDLVKVLQWLLTGILSIAMLPTLWIFRRALEDQKAHALRLDTLEKTIVTRDELEKVLSQMRADRIVMHQENRDSLERIEAKIDANEERNSTTGQDIRDSVNAVALQVAVLTERSKQANQARPT